MFLEASWEVGTLPCWRFSFGKGPTVAMSACTAIAVMLWYAVVLFKEENIPYTVRAPLSVCTGDTRQELGFPSIYHGSNSLWLPCPQRPPLRCPGQNPVRARLIGWAAAKLANHIVKWSWANCQMGLSIVTSWTVEPNQQLGQWSANKWGHGVICQVTSIVDHWGGKWRFNIPVGWLLGHWLQGNMWTSLFCVARSSNVTTQCTWQTQVMASWDLHWYTSGLITRPQATGEWML